VAWIHTNRHMLISMHDNLITTNPRYGIAHNGHRTWQLHIREVEEADKGEYMCQVNTNPMKKIMGYLHVVVPPRIDDENTSSDVEVRENSDVSLRCRATGTPEPDIKWRREDDALILLSGKKGVPSYQGDRLNMSKVTRLHMGPYLCIASNGVQPSVSKRILLKVDFAPMMWQPNQLVGAPLGTDITLECNLETHPRGMTFWEREDGTMLISNTKYDSLVLETGPYRLLLRLTIRNLKPDDFGVYKCVSKNPLGETEANIKLQDTKEPPPRHRRRRRGCTGGDPRATARGLDSVSNISQDTSPGPSRWSSHAPEAPSQTAAVSGLERPLRNPRGTFP
ncbi:hypothetical protein HPB47_023993, partial [Ixodes persulcatus]